MKKQFLPGAITTILLLTCLIRGAYAQTVPVFYGLTTTGGGHNLGTIFKYYPGISPASMDVFDFDTSTTQAGPHNYPGGIPAGSLIQASDGNLYGLTQYGGINGLGTIFQFNPATNVFTKKFDLTNNIGTNPVGSFFQASDGKLYATCEYGGANGNGTIIQYNLSTGFASNVHDFVANTDGYYPTASFIEYNGVLYSTTTGGGGSGYGTMFQYTLSSGNVVADINFDDVNLGETPYAGLLLANDNKIYGMTNNNSLSTSWGVLYAYNPSAGTTLPVYTFPETNNIGGKAVSALIQASNGLLYGMTTSNPDIFDFNISSLTPHNDYVFQDATDGTAPLGSLTQGSDGQLYGTTSTAGANNDGTIFSYNYNTTQFTPLVQLSAITGSAPSGSLLQVGTITLGIDDIIAGRLNALPNPASNNISITGLPSGVEATVEVKDLNGRTIIAENTAASDKINLNVQSLAPGMYMAEVKQNGINYMVKFIRSE